MNTPELDDELILNPRGWQYYSIGNFFLKKGWKMRMNKFGKYHDGYVGWPSINELKYPWTPKGVNAYRRFNILICSDSLKTVEMLINTIPIYYESIQHLKDLKVLDRCFHIHTEEYEKLYGLKKVNKEVLDYIKRL
jgi:hypothetical protein